MREEGRNNYCRVFVKRKNICHLPCASSATISEMMPLEQKVELWKRMMQQWWALKLFVVVVVCYTMWSTVWKESLLCKDLLQLLEKIETLHCTAFIPSFPSVESLVLCALGKFKGDWRWQFSTWAPSIFMLEGYHEKFVPTIMVKHVVSVM